MRVGFIGLGMIFPLHFEAIRKAPGVSVVGGHDIDPHRLTLARELRIPSFESLEELFMAQPDVVHVLVPPQDHVAVAKTVLERKVHCFLEKPAALNVPDIHKLSEAAELSGAALGVNHTQLFNPGFQRAARSIRQREIGGIEHVHVHYQMAAEFGTDHFVRRHPTNNVWELAPHPLALICFLLGRTVSVIGASMIKTPTNTPWSEWHATISCERGAATCYLSSQASREDLHVTIYGEDGTLYVDLSQGTVCKLSKRFGIPAVDALHSSWNCGVSLICQSTRLAGSLIGTALTKRQLKSVYDRSLGTSILEFYESLGGRQRYTSNLDLAECVTEACERVICALERYSLPS